MDLNTPLYAKKMSWRKFLLLKKKWQAHWRGVGTVRKVWIVGLLLMADGVEVGWMAEGVYETEQQAIFAARECEFIILVKVGERLPTKAIDAEKLYYPKMETWEESTLYKMRANCNTGKEYRNVI